MASAFAASTSSYFEFRRRRGPRLSLPPLRHRQPLPLLSPPPSPNLFRLQPLLPHPLLRLPSPFTAASIPSPSGPLNSGGGAEPLEGVEGLPEEQEQKKGNQQLRKRIVFGLGIGLGAGGIIAAGGWVFTLALAAAVFAASRC